MKLKNRALLLLLSVPLINVAQKENQEKYIPFKIAAGLGGAGLSALLKKAMIRRLQVHYLPFGYTTSSVVIPGAVVMAGKLAKKNLDRYNHRKEDYNRPDSLKEADRNPAYRKKLEDDNRENWQSFVATTAPLALVPPISYVASKLNDRGVLAGVPTFVGNEYPSARQLLKIKTGIGATTAGILGGLGYSGWNAYKYLKNRVKPATPERSKKSVWLKP